MLVPLSWLREYVEINLSTSELAERLTLAGLEVASIEQVGDWWDPEMITVGQVAAVHPHPNADRLVLVDVNYGGNGSQRVVTGAPNLYEFQGRSLAEGTLPVLKVAFARAGAELIDAYTDERPRPRKVLKPAKIRGVESAGMVCSELELDLSEEHEGILLLPEDAPVGVPLRDYLGDDVIEIDLTPDMARCLNMIGIAREVASLTGADIHLPADEWRPNGGDQASDWVLVRIDDPELCSRYTGVLIVDVEIGDSPPWIQERLRKAGMRPISNIVDITNYVMLEWGQPLHAFDYDILKTRAARVGDDKPTIIVRRAGPGEVFTTLDGVKRQLDDSMLMITDTAGSVAIAGIMGGLESEVGPTTRNILLESATFEGINNRRTAQKLRMSSEASYRFARGVPPTLNPIAARRAAELMRLYAGGRIVPGIADAYVQEQEQLVVYTTQSDMQRILGMDVGTDAIKGALEDLGFDVEEVAEPHSAAHADATFALHRLPGERLLACRPPWYRLDVRIPADLIEEVARMIGYERVGTTLIDMELPTQRYDPLLETQSKVRDLLVRAGLQETINRSLTTPEDHEKLGLASDGDDSDSAYVVVANPIAVERRVMRRSLLVSAMENLARNHRFADRLATFEVGRVYLPEAGNGKLPLEDRRVSLLLWGPQRIDAFYRRDDDNTEMGFFDLKGVVEVLLERLGFDQLTVQFRARPDTGSFGPRCAEVWLGNERLGLMGEIHPRVRSAFGLPETRVAAAELRLAPLIKPHWGLEPMAPISNYPPVVEDLAFEVDESVTARETADAIRAAGNDRLVDIELFDVYRGEPLAVGRKSLAFRLTYQSATRSLAEKEVTYLRQQIVAAVEKETGGRLRSE